MDISAILKNSSEGQWKTIEGKAEVKLRSLTPGEFMELSSEFTTTELVGGKPVSKMETKKLYEALFLYCATEWKNVFERSAFVKGEKVENGTLVKAAKGDEKHWLVPYPCDDKSKAALYRAWWPLFNVFKKFIDVELKSSKLLEEAQAKN